jgi:hypothetical protein
VARVARYEQPYCNVFVGKFLLQAVFYRGKNSISIWFDTINTQLYIDSTN